MNPDGMAGDRWSRLEELNRRVAFRIRARYGGEGRVDRTSANPYIRIGEIVPVLTLTAPTGPAAPSQCPFRVRTGHPIIA